MPDTAAVAGDPCFVRLIVILVRRAANTSNDFFFLLLGLGGRFLPLLAASLGGFEGLVELFEGLVLAFGGAD